MRGRPTAAAGLAAFLLAALAGAAWGAPPAAPSSPPPRSAPTSTGVPASIVVRPASPRAAPRASEPLGAMLRDASDGAFDMSRWLATRTGFLPVVLPITEPAVGVGAGAGAVFFHRREGAGAPGSGARSAPPSATAAVGGGTSNGTWAGGIAHLGIWREDTVRYLGGLGYGSVNLDFYGLGGALSDRPRNFTTEGLFLLQSLSFRVARSDFFVGARYRFLDVESTFRSGVLGLGIEPEVLDSRTGGAALTIGYDSRDNIFTPNRGLKVEAALWSYQPELGGDFSYRKVEAHALAFVPLRRNLVLGLRLEGRSAWGDVPFYDLPFVVLRGVPVFRYLGDHVATGEVEARWDVTDRWSLVGFAGTGVAGARIEDLPRRLGDADFRQDVVAGGVGVRYLIARSLGLRVGLDVAWSDDEGSLYVTVGSAWLRP